MICQWRPILKSERARRALVPLNRGDLGIDVIMRLHAPELERYQSWGVLKAEKIG